MAFLVFPGHSHAAALLYVDDNGNLGFGNIDPQSKVDVSGSIYSRLINGIASSTTSINWGTGNIHSIALRSSTSTLSFLNGQAGGEYTLLLNQDSAAGGNVRWPESVLWPGGIEPTLSSMANSIDMVKFIFNGANYLGTYALNFMASADTTISFDRITQTNSESTEYSHTTFGANRLLVLYIISDKPDDCSATYDNAPLTLQANQKWDSQDNWIQALTLINPDSGSHAVSISGCTPLISTVVSYRGVSQSDQPEVVTSTSGTDSIASSTITTIHDRNWILSAFGNNAGSPNSYLNVTQRGLGINNGLDVGDSNDKVTPAGPYTQNASWSNGGSDIWAQIQLAIKAAS